MNAPHPLDNEWRPFGNYYKLFYDVRQNDSEMIIEAVWPNAGRICDYEPGECHVRISLLHPYTGELQLNPRIIAKMEAEYGAWFQPASDPEPPQLPRGHTMGG